MTSCPKLTGNDANLLFITATNFNDLNLDTYQRTVGTVVKISCLSTELVVSGPDSVTCLDTGQWDYGTTKPTCVAQTTTGTTLTEEQLIIIGVFVGVGALALIVMGIVIAAICMQRRKRRRILREKNLIILQNDGGSRRDSRQMVMMQDLNTGRDSRYDYQNRGYNHGYEETSYYKGAAYPSSEPPTYDSESVSERKYATRTPMAVPITNVHDRKVYESVYHDRSLPDTRHSRYQSYVEDTRSLPAVHKGPKRPEGYSGEWIERHHNKGLTIYNPEAAQFGRDPFLWRPISSTAGRY